MADRSPNIGRKDGAGTSPFGVPLSVGDFHCGRCGTLLDGGTDEPVEVRSLRQRLEGAVDALREVAYPDSFIASRSTLSAQAREALTALDEVARLRAGLERIAGAESGVWGEIAYETLKGT